MNTIENIDQVEQIRLLTTFTTKLQRVIQHFLDFH